MDFSLKPPTRFAPAERESIERIREEHGLIAASDLAGPILDAIQEPLAVINSNRQLVHANRAFLEFARCRSVEDLLGMRLGELLGCVHAIEDVSGCGTHPSCKTCGTVNSALVALEGRACETEVDLDVERDGQEERLAFTLTATPLPARGRNFALLRVDAT